MNFFLLRKKSLRKFLKGCQVPYLFVKAELSQRAFGLQSDEISIEMLYAKQLKGNKEK